MEFPESLEIRPVGRVEGTIRPPGSKSITNRALPCAALADGESRLTGVLYSEDTRYMASALAQLGVGIDANWDAEEIRVVGCAGKLEATAEPIFVGNSGTSARFLTPILALGSSTYRLDGVARMRERPIGDLIAALGQLGVDVTSAAGTGCPPITVRAQGIAGGSVSIRGGISSQFLSGLLLAAPCARAPVELTVEDELVSRPYVEMTRAVMRSFGVEVAVEGSAVFRVAGPQTYQACDYAIEPDASAASYFFAMAAITGGRVTVEGLSRDSLQGDVAFADVLERMGCDVEWGDNQITVTGGELVGVDVDMNAISDTVQTLAAVALFASGPTTVRGVGHIRQQGDRPDRGTGPGIGEVRRDRQSYPRRIADQAPGRAQWRDG